MMMPVAIRREPPDRWRPVLRLPHRPALELAEDSDVKVIILRMSRITALDATEAASMLVMLQVTLACAIPSRAHLYPPPTSSNGTSPDRQSSGRGSSAVVSHIHVGLAAINRSDSETHCTPGWTAELLWTQGWVGLEWGALSRTTRGRLARGHPAFHWGRLSRRWRSPRPRRARPARTGSPRR